MRNLLLATRWPLLFCARSRFFWGWNAIILVLILILNRITYFEFERSSILVSEFFLSTIALAAAVTSVAFHINMTLRQKVHGEWGLLLSGPCSPLALVGGLLIALGIVQLVGALLFLAAHCGALALSDRAVDARILGSFAVVLLKILSLGAFHLLVAVVLRETWALIAMVGGYLLGQMSELFYRNVGPVRRWLLDVFYCVVPDLNPLGYLDGAGRLDVPVFLLVLLHTTLYVGVVTALAARAADANRAFRGSI